MEKIKISVVINTYNEESNIKNCLSSVIDWADEIVLVDMYSTDATVSIALDMGAVVFMHEKIEDFDRARKFAIECAKNNWIFLLDADELVSRRLVEDIDRTVKDGALDVVWVPRLNYMFGAPILHGGWGPNQDAQMRLFKRDKIHVSGKIHNFIAPCHGALSKKIEYSSDKYILHFNFIDISHQVNKINKYTSIEAMERMASGRAYPFWYAVLSTIWIFFKHFILKAGILDGWRGFALSVNMMMYKILIYEKMKESKSVGGRKKVLEKYFSIAEAMNSRRL